MSRWATLSTPTAYLEMSSPSTGVPVHRSHPTRVEGLASRALSTPPGASCCRLLVAGTWVRACEGEQAAKSEHFLVADLDAYTRVETSKGRQGLLSVPQRRSCNFKAASGVGRLRRRPTDRCHGTHVCDCEDLANK